ncbi:MAG: HIT domain-containing protein [Methylotenera sp.]|nr:HIT domain-containing protein [Methylotenera sp.]
MEKCPFCDVDQGEVYLKNELAFVRHDKFPVSTGHLLVIPYRHISNYFDLTSEERHACWDLLDIATKELESLYSPDGFNVGLNVNEAAGQTVWHAHIHLIPRYKGDVENPRGGVRGVIPQNKSY